MGCDSLGMERSNALQGHNEDFRSVRKVIIWYVLPSFQGGNSAQTEWKPKIMIIPARAVIVNEKFEKSGTYK